MLKLQLPRTLGAWLARLVPAPRRAASDATDTVLNWPPTPARLLSSSERHAHKCLAQVLALEHPKGFVLAHVPLHKLVRVPRQRPHREWLARTGLLTVDFALCDEHGYARSLVLLPLPEDQAHARRQRERLLRVLAATELAVLPWQRAWPAEAAEALRATVFPKPQGPGYFVDTPNAAH